MDDLNTAEIMEKGMTCLLESLGPVETERFISIIIRERFDYTKWRKDFFGDAGVEELNSAAAAYAQSHPIEFKKNVILDELFLSQRLPVKQTLFYMVIS